MLEPRDGPSWGGSPQTGRVPRGYLGDPDKSARTFPTVTACATRSLATERGCWPTDRWSSSGRDSVTINTGGEKVFAEEVEQAIKHHPDVFDVVVVGRPSERWGQEVVAVVQLRDGHDARRRRTCWRPPAEHVARYKLPKAVVRVPVVERSPSGKPDYRWAAEVVEAS